MRTNNKLLTYVLNKPKLTDLIDLGGGVFVDRNGMAPGACYRPEDIMVKVYKYQPEGLGNPLIIGAGFENDLADYLSNEDIGNKVIISIEEMSLGEFQALPEHKGW